MIPGELDDLPALGISAERRIDLGFICGLVQDEVSREAAGHGICVNDVFKGAMSSPYLKTEGERIMVAGTLAYALAGGLWVTLLTHHKASRFELQRKHPDISLEEEMARYREIVRDELARGARK